MVRDFNKQDMDSVMELWLNANISAHSFIESEYWKSNYDMVRGMMPSATIYIYEKNSVVQGFVGLIDDYIAGIFVSEHVQSKGLGKKLLDYIKNKKDALALSVYKDNIRAVNFYLREGFIVSNEQIDENTGKIELHMNWKKQATS